MIGLLQTATVVLLVALAADRCNAHETDQFTVPTGKEFVDHGDYWNNLLYEAVEDGVESLNRDIGIARRLPIGKLRDLRLAHLHSPETVAARVRRRLPSAIWAIEGLELKLRLQPEHAEHPDRILIHRPSLIENIYGHIPLFPDPRQINRILVMRSSTIKVHGTYLGTDKLGHFVSMGYFYFLAYRLAMNAGADHDDALRRATLIGQWGPLSERGIVGYIPCGVYSNADMIANYLGMKFYINLTQPVRLKGEPVQSMLSHEGDFWTIRHHVHPESRYFALYISDHLDEALNPCLFEWDVRIAVRRELKKRRRAILDWYAGDNPAKRNPAYFENLCRQYSTYYGEDYGHAGGPASLITIGNTCFDERATQSALPAWLRTRPERMISAK